MLSIPEFSAAFRAGDFSPGADWKAVHETPAPGHLPRRQLPEQMLLEIILPRISHDERHNHFTPAPIGVWHTEHDALLHGPMRQQGALDDFGRHFAPRHVDLISSAAAHINQTILNLSQIARLECAT